MYSFLLIVSLYMMMNIFTDFKTLKTKNWNHLLFGIIGLSLLFYHYLFLKGMEIMGTCLVIGVLREQIPVMRISPGDTKMLIVLSTFLMVKFPYFNAILLGLMLHILFLLISIFIMGLWLAFSKVIHYFGNIESGVQTYQKGGFCLHVKYQGKNLIHFKYRSPESLPIYFSALSMCYLLGGFLT